MTAVRLARLATPLTALALIATLVVPATPAAASPASPAVPVASAAPATAAAPAAAAAVDPTPCAGAVAPGDAACTVVTRATPATTTPRQPGAASDAAAGVAPITAGQLRTVYGVAGQTAPAGTTVGIVTAYDAPTLEADLATFRSTNGLPACTTANGCFRKVDQRGRTVPPNKNRTVAPVYGTAGWELETSLDTQAVSGMCPSCAILVVEADGTSLTAALGPAVVRAQALGATLISNSFASPESADMVPADQMYWSTLSVPVFAGSGDHGYDNYAGTSGQGTAYYPAASPSVVAVGGTSATVSGGSLTGETAWSGSGSGCTLGFARPAAQTTYFTATSSRPDDAAHCSTDGRYAPVGGQPARATADLSALADPNAPGFSVVRGGTWTITGGTSLAVQLVAGIAAYAGPRPAGSSITTVAYVLSALGGPTGLLDVTTGSNDPAGGATCGNQRVCVARAGWDGPTGLGAPRGLSVFAPLLSVGGSPLPGGPLTVSGSNLLPGESATLTSASTVFGTAPVNPDGTWSSTVVLPLAAQGSLPVTVTGATSGLTATVTVTVATASLTVPTTALTPGQSFRATASGLSPGENVTFHVDGAGTDVVRPANDAGTAVATLTAPVPSPGTTVTSVRVTATGGTSRLAPTATITVQPAVLTVTPTTAAPGAAVTLQGSGFAVGATVTFAGATGPSGPTTVGADGTFTATVTLPDTARTSVVVTATTGGASASTTVTVPAPTLTAPALAAGASGTLSGAFFAAGATLTVTVVGGLSAPATVTAGPDGSFLATVAVPPAACPGPSTVTVTGRSGQSASATVATPFGNRLPSGCTAPTDATLTSPSGQYRMVVQGDGNLVLYSGGRPIWYTGTTGANAGLVLQGDGNLVLYSGSRVLWNAGTRGGASGGALVLQDDGNLVLYDGNGTPRWYTGFAGTDRLYPGDVLRPGWSIHTANGSYALVMQADGNLVLYTVRGAAAWSTNTRAAAASPVLSMQADGNLVLYLAGRAAFFTSTYGSGNQAVVQPDGNLVVYDPAGRALWNRLGF